ncbi:MAG: hypothetical protein AAF585_27455 [Verrucomicrobiota bacterium]
MKESNTTLIAVAVAGVVIGGSIAGYAGYRLGQGESQPEPEAEVVAEPEIKPAPTVATQPEPEPEPPMSDSEFENWIGGLEAAPELPAGFDPEAMEARRQRWESMTVEQRRMLRRSMFTALANVEGIEEVMDAAQKGEIDFSQFSLNPEEIADRMEMHAVLMDQEAMDAEVTSTLQ